LGVPGHGDRTARTMPGLVTEFEVSLEPPEVREDGFEAPARVAQGLPLVEVGRRAAEREPDDRRRATERLHPAQLLDVAELLRFGDVPPVEGASHVPAVADLLGQIRPKVRACLEQDHRPRGGLGQSRGDDTSGSSASDDGDVVLLLPSQLHLSIWASRNVTWIPGPSGESFR